MKNSSSVLDLAVLSGPDKPPTGWRGRKAQGQHLGRITATPSPVGGVGSFYYLTNCKTVRVADRLNRALNPTSHPSQLSCHSSLSQEQLPPGCADPNLDTTLDDSLLHPGVLSPPTAKYTPPLIAQLRALTLALLKPFPRLSHVCPQTTLTMFQDRSQNVYLQSFPLGLGTESQARTFLSLPSHHCPPPALVLFPNHQILPPAGSSPSVSPALPLRFSPQPVSSQRGCPRSFHSEELPVTITGLYFNSCTSLYCLFFYCLYAWFFYFKCSNPSSIWPHDSTLRAHNSSGTGLDSINSYARTANMSLSL